MGTHYANLDYINLFEKLGKIQSFLSEDLFINKIKFNNPEEVWKIYTGQSNNLLLFFSKLALQDQILFIKFLDYYLLDNDEKIELFKDRAEVISSIISTFKEKHRSNNLTKIELYGFYDVFFNQYNKEQILIDFGATFKYIETDKNEPTVDKNDEITRNVCDWLNNFNSILRENYKDIWEKYNTPFLKENESEGDKPYIEPGATSKVEVDINAGKQFFEIISPKLTIDDFSNK